MGYQNSDFAEATGTLRVLEKKILTGDDFDKLAEARSGDATEAEAALKALTQAADYDFSAAERPEDYEKALSAGLQAVYAMLFKISPDPRLVEILAAKYDYHNIKTAVKAKFLPGAKADAFDSVYVSVTATDPKLIRAALSDEKSLAELPAHLAEAIGAVLAACEKAADPQVIDRVLDLALLDHMRTLADEIGNEFISDYVGTVIDFYNIKTLMRVRNMQKTVKFLQDSLAAGGKTDASLFIDSFNKQDDAIASAFYYKYFGDVFKKAIDESARGGNFGALEKGMDNYVMEHVRKSKYIAFGPEPLFAFILAKENEIRQIRILMTCKINQISGDVLRERLRDNYA